VTRATCALPASASSFFDQRAGIHISYQEKMRHRSPALRGPLGHQASDLAQRFAGGRSRGRHCLFGGSERLHVFRCDNTTGAGPAYAANVHAEFLGEAASFR
jgi:hypothetical protein